MEKTAERDCFWPWAKTPRRYKATTDCNHKHPVAPNLLDRRFDVGTHEVNQNLQYQWVTKYQAAPGRAEAALSHISGLFWFYTPCHSLSQLLS